jgi:hypothetical protein
LQRLHDRMADGVGVSARMAHRGRVATADMSTGQTQSQVDPRSPEPQALLTALRRARSNRTNHAEVRVECNCHRSPRYASAGAQRVSAAPKPSFARGIRSALSAGSSPPPGVSTLHLSPPIGKRRAPLCAHDQQDLPHSYLMRRS